MGTDVRRNAAGCTTVLFRDDALSLLGERDRGLSELSGARDTLLKVELTRINSYSQKITCIHVYYDIRNIFNTIEKCSPSNTKVR